MPPLRDIRNNTPADAVDVDYNFGTIETHIGSELINRDGSVAMTGPLSLAGPPAAPQQAATKAYVDSNVIPIGTIWEFAGNVAPAGWAFCDGSSKSTTDPAYAALFAVIGYRHGGAGANFNLPDRRARVPIGYWAGDAIAGTLGAKGGNRDAQLPSHTHTQAAHDHAGSTANSVNLDHLHGMDHTHDSNVRAGFDINTGNFEGPSNAVAAAGASVAAGTALTFTKRQTAVTQNQVPGGGNQLTGDTRDYTDAMNQNAAHGHPLTMASNTPTINPQGVAPTNLNYPLYEVVNYMVRIG